MPEKRPKRVGADGTCIVDNLTC